MPLVREQPKRMSQKNIYETDTQPFLLSFESSKDKNQFNVEPKKVYSNGGGSQS